MANKFKYNKLGSEANSIFKGNWAIDNTARNTGGGPSSATSFYHGANIPEGGYTVYSPNGVFVANNDTELVGKVNSLGADVTDISQALTWASGQSTHMVLNKQIDNIVIEYDATYKNWKNEDITYKSEKIDLDNSQLEKLNNRLSFLYSLAQKHKVDSVEELLVIFKKLEDQISEIDSFDFDLEQLRNKVKKYIIDK